MLRTHCTLLAISPVYRTSPQGYSDQADFLNMAVKLSTTLTPLALKSQVLAEIERTLGRVRDPNNKNAPRTIDVDISLWDSLVTSYGEKPWLIPDPDILRFAHVAVPLADLAPDYRHPETGQKLAEIAGQFDRTSTKREIVIFD